MNYVALSLLIFLGAGSGTAYALTEAADADALAALLSQEGRQGNLSLTWEPVKNPTLQGYKVLLGRSPGKYEYAVKRTVQQGTTFTVRLPSSNTWYFVVKAYNDAGDSPPSKEVSGIPH